MKTLGEEGGFSAAEDPDLMVVRFAVDSIAPAECDRYYDPSYSPAENGHLTAVALRFATGPEYAGTQLAQIFTVNPNDFQFIGADGVTKTNLATMAAYSCQGSGAGAFPGTPLAPGSSYTGTVTLDLPAPNGTLVYRPALLDGAGWEWQF